MSAALSTGRSVAVAALAFALLAQQPAGVFRIQPLRPVEELRREALAVQPPKEDGNFLPSDLVELSTLEPRIKLDIRYATADNFLSTPLYTQARAFLQRPAAEALVRAHRKLTRHGYGVLIHDGYRPWYVTWIFWHATPPELRHFVANPAAGSRHNRGCAVDLTLYNLQTGQAVEMPSLYDEFSERAKPDYNGGTAESRRLRDLLRAAMENEGFTVYEHEWWHFDYTDWRKYRIENVPFEQLSAGSTPQARVISIFVTEAGAKRCTNTAPRAAVLSWRGSTVRGDANVLCARTSGAARTVTRAC